MEITYAPRDILQIDDARIIHRNFSGAERQFNPKGNRNFSVVIDDEELANELIERGWNVKIKRDEEDGSAFMFLPVKIKFNGYGPKAYLRTGENLNELDEESIGILDDVDILQVDLDIRPNDWTMPGGKSGRTAYLNAIHVVQRVDRFAAQG